MNGSDYTKENPLIVEMGKVSGKGWKLMEHVICDENTVFNMIFRWNGTCYAKIYKHETDDICTRKH